MVAPGGQLHLEFYDRFLLVQAYDCLVKNAATRKTSFLFDRI
jgi:hypothetical protein